MLAILDICSVAAGAMGALILRFDATSIPQEYFWGAVHSMPVYFVITIAVMAAFKLYNRVWTYASLMAPIIKASVLIEAIFVCYHVFMQINMPEKLLSAGIHDHDHIVHGYPVCQGHIEESPGFQYQG